MSKPYEWCFFLLMLHFLLPEQAFGQPIFDLQSSKKYAAYLMESSRFSEAAEEYERIIQLFSGNDSLKWNAGNAWYQAGHSEKSLFILNGVKPIFPDHASLLLLCKMEQGQKINRDSLDQSLAFFSNTFRADACMLTQFSNDNLRRKFSCADSLGLSELRILKNQVEHFRWKKPGKAAFLSALVPGLGKVYTKDYKDASIAFLYVSLSAYQVYRGLEKKNGQWAPYSIIFAGIGGIFYLGNIYGAYNSARRYNLNAAREFKSKANKKFAEYWLNR